MAQRDVSAADILNVLTKGQVTLVEIKQDILWRALGRDIDGRKLEVIAVVDDEEIKIKVVTVF
jgi:DNA-binding transcriptional regulator YdaS (Cro superfamily)